MQLFKRHRKKHEGLTVLEVMLVLVVSSLFVVIGIRQYQGFKYGADAESVRTNADKLFHAASLFYYANCRSTAAQNKLAPTLTPPPSTVPDSPYVVNVQTELVDAGFMKGGFAVNPLLDSSTDYEGYHVQFVQALEPRYVCTTTSTSIADCPDADKKQIGTILNWTIQVSAKSVSPTAATTIQRLTAADCLTSDDGNGTGGVLSCSDSGNTGDYVSYQRQPSFALPTEAQSGLWIQNKNLIQFNRLYETDNMTYLLNVSHDPEVQYFTCGG